MSDAAAAKLGARIVALQGLGAVPTGLALGECLTARRGQAVFAVTYSGENAILKAYDGNTARIRAESAAAALTSVSRRMVGPDYTVPRLIWAAPEHGLVVMERARGTAMSKVLAAEPDAATRQRLVAGAAHWLLAFCESPDIAPHFYPQGWIERAVEGRDTSALTTDAARLLAALRHQMPLVRGLPFARGGLHGDFVPGNLLVAEGQICGIDIQGTFTLPVLREAATFLVWMTVKTPLPKLYAGIAPEDVASMCEALGVKADAMPILWFFIGEQLLRRRLDGANKPCPAVLAIMIRSYLSADFAAA